MSKRMTFQEFITLYNKKYDNTNFEFDESTFVDSHTPMRVICKKHGEFWKAPRNILKYNCRKCSYELRGREFRLTTDEFINKAINIHGNRYDYSKVVYEHAKKKVEIICDIHGIFKQTPNDHLSGKGCPFCNESHLEKNVEKILNNNNINFIRQYSPEWLGRQSLDFYLPNYNLAIECQGKQHFGLSGWDIDQNLIISLDIKKYNLCNENNINIIYVTEEKYLNNIPEIEIYNNNIFDIKNLIECIQQRK